MLWPAVALADGKILLEDGIAFYESLDIDRAKKRLSAASVAKDLGPKDRATAFLYLGMLHFDLGANDEAERAFEKALELDRTVIPPKGTSPKKVALLEAVRKRVEAAGTPEIEPGGVRSPPPPPPDVAPPPPPPPPPPDVAPPPPPPPPPLDAAPPPPSDLTAETTPPAEEGISPWVWVGVGGALAVGAVIGIVVVATGSSSTDCQGETGGCLAVTFD